MADQPITNRIIALLAELGIRRTEITTPMLASMQTFIDEMRTEPQERMASEYQKMVAMMREQRDGFRIPSDKHGLGASHSDEARHCCAELLDWFLISYYDPRPMVKVSFVMPSGDFKLDVSWANSPRKFDVVDMADIVMSRVVMRPLRENRDLWKSVRVIANGSAIAWGEPRSADSNDFDMDFASDALHSLAEEQHPYRGRQVSQTG